MLHIVIRVIHILAGALWAGSTFFAAWFVIPAAIEAGAEGGKVMAGVMKRGWVALAPSIAGFTVLTGLWLYRPYMGDAGHAAMAYGSGGVLGILALLLGGSVVGRSLKQAGDYAAKAATMPDGADRAKAMNSAKALQQRALMFARIVSVLVIITVIIMSLGTYL